jgi:beta-aspartyl-peptidase (threonine type)
VGDSPLIGCGTYADDHGAVSCTGQGEAIIRVVLAKAAVDFLKNGLDSQSAAKQAIDLLAAKTESKGGLILIDRHGKIGYARNTTHMPVCAITGSEQILSDS